MRSNGSGPVSTRAISLGSGRYGPAMRPELRGKASAIDHERPFVTGVNGPRKGRGLALALSGAADLVDAIAENAADPGAQALALDRLANAHVAPFYHDQAVIDAARLAMTRHVIFGAPPPRAACDSRPGHLLPAARGRVPGPDRVPRAVEDQRDGLPARAGLHRSRRHRPHAGNAQPARRRAAARPANPRPAPHRPHPGAGFLLDSRCDRYRRPLRM